jgi:hypothetical protein
MIYDSNRRYWYLILYKLYLQNSVPVDTVSKLRSFIT